jgi:hypothetical protein
VSYRVSGNPRADASLINANSLDARSRGGFRTNQQLP